MERRDEIGGRAANDGCGGSAENLKTVLIDVGEGGEEWEGYSYM